MSKKTKVSPRIKKVFIKNTWIGNSPVLMVDDIKTEPEINKARLTSP